MMGVVVSQNVTLSRLSCSTSISAEHPRASQKGLFVFTGYILWFFPRVILHALTDRHMARHEESQFFVPLLIVCVHVRLCFAVPQFFSLSDGDIGFLITHFPVFCEVT